MMILGILAFYGLAVLLSVGGLAFFFRIGRVGPAQFQSYRMPAPQRLTSDDYNAIAEVVGIPTSPSDLLLSFTPIGWVSTFGAWLILLARRPSLAFIAIIIGGLFGKLWYMMSLALLALEIVLLQKGVSYRPQWIVPGVKWETAISYIIGGYFVAYFIGKVVGSPQRSFNTARLAYERVVARRGYWFDNRNDANHYHKDVESLQDSLRAFDRSLNRLGETPTSELNRQQAMTVQYQRSLLLATLSHYDAAIKTLEAAHRLKELLKGSALWDAGEEQEKESQMLFLEGELLVTHGDREGARALFERSRSIDLKLGDRPGVDKNDERLAAISAT